MTLPPTGEPTAERWVQIDGTDIWVQQPQGGITRKIAHVLNPEDVPAIVAAHNAALSRSPDGWRGIAVKMSARIAELETAANDADQKREWDVADKARARSEELQNWLAELTLSEPPTEGAGT